MTNRAWYLWGMLGILAGVVFGILTWCYRTADIAPVYGQVCGSCLALGGYIVIYMRINRVPFDNRREW